MSGLTDAELMRYSGFSHAWWYGQKNNRATPTKRSFERLLDMFPVTREWLLKGEGASPKAEEVKAVIRSATERMVNRVPEMRTAGMPIPPKTGAIMTRPGDPMPVPFPPDIRDAIKKIETIYKIPISIIENWLAELVRANLPK